MDFIDLGQSSPSGCAPCSPCGDAESKKCYPSLYFTCDMEMELPDEGTATIKFRKIEDTENTRNADDPKYRYELEVQGIAIKGGTKSDEPADLGDKLKNNLKKSMDAKAAYKKEE